MNSYTAHLLLIFAKRLLACNDVVALLNEGAVLLQGVSISNTLHFSSKLGHNVRVLASVLASLWDGYSRGGLTESSNNNCA